MIDTVPDAGYRSVMSNAAHTPAVSPVMIPWTWVLVTGMVLISRVVIVRTNPITCWNSPLFIVPHICVKNGVCCTINVITETEIIWIPQVDSNNQLLLVFCLKMSVRDVTTIRVACAWVAIPTITHSIITTIQCMLFLLRPFKIQLSTPSFSARLRCDPSDHITTCATITSMAISPLNGFVIFEDESVCCRRIVTTTATTMNGCSGPDTCARRVVTVIV